MKMLKNILIAVAVIVFIALVGIYFLPNHFSVSNSIEINKPADVVYSQLSDYNKWGAWDPWKEKEPEATSTVEGPAGQVGHKMTWDGKKLGAGSMTLVAAIPNQSLTNDVAITRPGNFSFKDNWKIEAMGDKTKVTWTNTGGLKYPVGRLMGLTVDKMMGGDQKHGLDNLKKLCESIPAPVAATDSTSVPKAM